MPGEFGVDYLAGPDLPFTDDFYPLQGARGVDPDVACSVGWTAFAWIDDTTTPAHARLLIKRETGVCTGKCITQEEFDLGPARIRHGLSIALTNSMAWVTWKPDSRIVVQRIALAWDGSMTATPRPLVTVLTSAGASRPIIAADGHDVALAYDYRGDTRVRYSTDRGQTFGAAVIVIEAPCTDCEAGSRPLSIDMLDSYVVVETLAGGPGGFATVTLVTDDGFGTWSERTGPDDALQIGALFRDGSATKLAEARYNTFLANPQPTQQRVRYRTGLLP